MLEFLYNIGCHDSGESGNSSGGRGNIGTRICHAKHPNTWDGLGPLTRSRLSVAVELFFLENACESQLEH